MNAPAHIPPCTQQVRERAITGAFWSYSSYGLQFLIQAVALVVLARQLSAQDFGIFALGLMVVGICEAAFQFSFGPSIVQLEKISDRHVDVAWTCNVLFSLLGTVLMSGMIWIFVGQGPDALVTKNAVFAMLSSVMLTSLGSSGLLLLHRNLHTRDMVGIALTRVFLRYGGAIALAFYIRDFWALVISYLVGFAAEAAMSYWIAPRRVRFVLDREIFRELLRFSGWVHLKKMSFWGGRYVDSFAVNAMLGVVTLGIYSRAFNLASLPNNQAQLLCYRVFAPLFASAQNQPERLARLVRHALDVTMLSSVPVVLIMMLHGESLVRLVLGHQWNAASSVLGILSLGLLLRSVNDVQATALRAAGRPRFEFIISAIQVLITGASLAPAIWWKGMEGAGYALVMGNVVSLAITEKKMHDAIGFSLRSHSVAIAGVLGGSLAAWGASFLPLFSHVSLFGNIASAVLELSAFFFIQLLLLTTTSTGVLHTLWLARHHLSAMRKHSPAAPIPAEPSFSS